MLKKHSLLSYCSWSVKDETWTKKSHRPKDWSQNERQGKTLMCVDDTIKICLLFFKRLLCEELLCL